MGNQKLLFIDYLKAFSVLYIVGFWHLFNYTKAFPGYDNPVTLAFTEIVLGLFVFISGFLIYRSAKRSKGVIDFYKKRLIRIYPLYFLAVILFYFYGINDSLTTVKSLFLVSMLYTPAPWTLWFIAMIMLFYLAAPILARLSANPKRYLIAVLLIMALMLAFQVTIRTGDVRMLTYLPCFCLGIYCAANGINNGIVSTKCAIALLLCGILGYVVDVNFGLSKILLVLSGSYLIFAISYQKRNDFVDVGFVSQLSYGSYAMYLFHRPIFMALKSLYFPVNGIHQIVYLVCFCLIFITLFCWSIQRLYDKLYSASALGRQV